MIKTLLEMIFNYGEDQLTSSIARGIASGNIKATLNTNTRERINQSSACVAKIVEANKVVYGINTGFGPLCTSIIDADDTRKLQENILKSHAVGVGEPISLELAKLMLILKAHALSKGYSGVQLATVERIIWHIDHDVIPVVPKQGSVGASGDLAPLSHLFLPLIGYGEVYVEGKKMTTEEAFSIYKLEPISLAAKEGLALINGTQFMAAHAVMAVCEMSRLLDNADLIAALMVEGLNGSVKPFYSELHELRPYKGNQYVASTILNLLKDSPIVASHVNCSRVQDPYSLRCIPQIHGASRNAWLHLKEITEIEINSVTDNPILINEELTISGGNFHGQPIAMVMDYATLAVSEMGNVSDRRVYLSLEGETAGVPALLMKSTGLNSGFMILQYTTAALASENKSLCFPASADSIPTSMGQEDHVSMGSISGRKLLQVIDNVDKIHSIELLCATQAKDYHKPIPSTPIMEAVHEHIRKHIPHIEEDQPMTDLLKKALEIVQSAELIHLAVKEAEDKSIPYLGKGVEMFKNY